MAKHHRLIFGVLLAFIVVSFVFYTGSGSAMDLLGIRKSPSVCGIKLNAPEADVYRSAIALRGGRELSQQQYVQTLAQRIYLVHLAETYQIPNPTQNELAEFSRNFFASLGVQGPLNEKTLQNIKQNLGLSDEDLSTILVHEWKIDKLIDVLIGSPASSEEETNLRWQELNTSWTLEIASLDEEKFKFAGTPSNEDLAAYYAKHGENYRIAPTVSIAYAALTPKTNIAEIENPQEAELKMFVKMSLPQASSEEISNEIEKNKPAWIKKWKQDRITTNLASEISDMLAEKLPQDIINPKSEDFEKALKESGLSLKSIPAFPKNKAPANTDVPVEILSTYANVLNETGWRTDAIPSNNKVYVLIYRGSEPSRIPELSEVRESVLEAWKTDTHHEQFVKHAQETGEKLRKAVAGGKDFATAAKELNMLVKKEAPFTIQTVPANLNNVGNVLIEAVKKHPLNTVSEMVLARNGALFAYATNKTLPTLDTKSETYTALLRHSDRMTSMQTLQMQLAEQINAICSKILPQNGQSEE